MCKGVMRGLLAWLLVLLAVGCGSDEGGGGASMGGAWGGSGEQGQPYGAGSSVGAMADAGGGGGLDAGGAAWDSAGSDTWGGDISASDSSAEAPQDDAGEADGAAVPTASVPANPFVLASADPYSTFAADVDDASFELFLQYVAMGGLPPPQSVRLEEFVNAFEYDDARPPTSAEHPFAVKVEAARSPFDTATRIVRVGIAGKDLQDVAKKATNLVFLVDISGSMSSPNKLPLVKTLLTAALDVLDPSDTVSIVTYAGATGVALAPTAVANKASIAAAIEKMKPGGGTNGAGGIQLAYQQAEKAKIPGGINHVVLCTDGDFNIGVSNTKALVELIVQKRKLGITLTAIGFGGPGYNDAMMEEVSNAGNGIYSTVASAAKAIAYAKTELLATIVHIAQDVKLQVEWNPAHVHAWRLLGYENRTISDAQFLDDSVDGGEIGAGHKVTALFEVVLDAAALPQPKGAPAPIDVAGAPIVDASGAGLTPEVEPQELLRAKVRYKLPGAKESDPSIAVYAALPAEAVGEQSVVPLSDASPDLRWAVGVAALAERLKGSPFRSAADHGVAWALLQGATAGKAEREAALPSFGKATALMP